MIDHGRVRSTARPEPIVIDEFSVWQHTNIQDVSENEFVGYEYNMIQYTKDEFILNQAAENETMQQEITNTQLALCEVYELMG